MTNAEITAFFDRLLIWGGNIRYPAWISNSYRINHCAIATAIALLCGGLDYAVFLLFGMLAAIFLAGAIGGSLFYAGREWQQSNSQGQPWSVALGDWGVPTAWLVIAVIFILVTTTLIKWLVHVPFPTA